MAMLAWMLTAGCSNILIRLILSRQRGQGSKHNGVQLHATISFKSFFFYKPVGLSYAIRNKTKEFQFQFQTATTIENTTFIFLSFFYMAFMMRGGTEGIPFCFFFVLIRTGIRR